MKKAYVTPEVIVHGTVEEITRMGILPYHPIWNPGGRPGRGGGLGPGGGPGRGGDGSG